MKAGGRGRRDDASSAFILVARAIEADRLRRSLGALLVAGVLLAAAGAWFLRARVSLRDAAAGALEQVSPIDAVLGAAGKTGR